MPRLREFRWEVWAAHAEEQFLQDGPSLVAIDTETTGLGFYDLPFAATVSWYRPGGNISSWYFELDGLTAPARHLRRILERAGAWVGHNVKFDLQKLRLIDVVDDAMFLFTELHDTQTLYHLLDENGRKGLKHLAVTVLGHDDTIEVEVKSGPNKGTTRKVPREEYRLAAVRRKLGILKEEGYHRLPREVVVPYAMRDTEFTLELYTKLRQRLDRVADARLWDWYQTEMRLLRSLLSMEEEGLRLDLDYLQSTTSEYGVRVMKGLKEIQRISGQADINPNSPAQLLVAFERRGLKLEGTDVATLAEYPEDELAAALLQYREDNKLYKTYLKGLLDEQHEGLVHPSFNPTGARTGRLSSSSAKKE